MLLPWSTWTSGRTKSRRSGESTKKSKEMDSNSSRKDIYVTFIILDLIALPKKREFLLYEAKQEKYKFVLL